MKISQKIALGFGLFMIFVALVLFLNYKSFFKEREISNKINTIYSPSLRLLEDLDGNFREAHLYILNIVNVETKKLDPSRSDLIYILDHVLPKQIKQLDSIAKFWDEDAQKKKEVIKTDISEFTSHCWDDLTALPDLSFYKVMENRIAVEYDYLSQGQMTILPKKIKRNIEELIENQHANLNDANLKLAVSAESRNSKALILIGGIIIVGIVIMVFVTRSIIIPINQLKKMILYLGKGKYPSTQPKISNDEIGEMATAVNQLVVGLKKTKEFTLEVGRGNFDQNYEPLSMEDELGHALLVMRAELANNERILEHKVEERTSQMVMERERATRLYQDLNDSIEYAKRIQTSFLSDKKKVISMFKDAFIIYKPKDKVSGDFFWAKNMGDKCLIAAVDCTGHGVPGAFVSMVGNNVLNQISKVYTNPASILNNLHTISSRILKKGREEEPLRDGMDISLCLIDKKNLKLEFAGAYNSAYVIRNERLVQLKGDRFAIGSNQAYKQSYTNQSFDLKEGDVIYLFSDGYADQFGGPKNKKYLIKSFREKLLSISSHDMETQEQMLEEELASWRGSNEQVDDILVIGFQI